MLAIEGRAMVTEEAINGMRKELNVVARRADFFVAASFMEASFVVEEHRPRLHYSTNGETRKAFVGQIPGYSVGSSGFRTPWVQGRSLLYTLFIKYPERRGEHVLA